jgi:hypothetical protein
MMTTSAYDLPRPAEPPLSSQVIMMIRHAEKPHHADSPYGITPDGEYDRHSLTVTGWIRAGALVGLFAPARGEPPTGLYRPDTVYGSAYEDGHSKRSVQTVTPLAARLGMDVIRRYTSGDEARLAKELSARPGATMVSWNHEAIPKIAQYLGEVTPTPPAHWPRDRYDIVWTFTRNGDGWRFAQVPQMLLPGDLPHPIADLARSRVA